MERAGAERRVTERLARYGAALLDANQQFNLTGAKSTKELVPHLLDALTIAPYIRSPYADVGSGGGLPAIPAAIATGATPTLIEAAAKKAAFLRSVLESLGLEGTVINERAEVAGRNPSLRERFSSVTARAVGSAPTVAELALPLLIIGGRAILQRGVIAAPERAALDDATFMLGGRVSGEEILDAQRRIIIVEKVAETPARFPRRAGIPEKRPLCLPHPRR